MSTRGFTAAEYAYAFDPTHRRAAHGDIRWFERNRAILGTFDVSGDEHAPDLDVDGFVRLQPMRPLEPTLLVRIRGVHALRIDINQAHRHEGVLHYGTHVQYHASGSEEAEHFRPVDEDFPTLTVPFTEDFGERQLERCFRAASPIMNIDVSGVSWTMIPTRGVQP